jgi:dynein heavy chain
MVPGIKPRVAAERLKVFQKQFEDMERKWIVYQSGEELFGLPVTEYPDLVRIKKELRLLSSLYNLYTDVIETVTGYEDILWAEIDLDNISQQVTDFQAKCRKLPKGMREWDAYLELKKTIDDFCETLPLLQLMSHPAMRPRHWEAISAITKVQIPFDSELFKLRNVLECPLLKNYEDIEDIATGAVKEADIE